MEKLAFLPQFYGPGKREQPRPVCGKAVSRTLFIPIFRKKTVYEKQQICEIKYILIHFCNIIQIIPGLTIRMSR
jgi:hypothetical protein